MKKVFLLIAALMFYPLVVQAQVNVQGTISTSGSTCAVATACVIVQLPQNSNAVGINVSGTFTGTLQFEVSVDGQNFAAVNAFPPNSTTAVTSTTATGTWSASTSGMIVFRVRASALASGAALVSLSTSKALNTASISGSGGGSGTVTSVTFTGDGVVDSSTPSSAVTTSGTVTASLNTQAANTVFGNFTGSTAAPTFSAAPVFSAALLTGFPTFNQNTTGSAASLSATLGCNRFPALTGDTTTSAGSCATTTIALNGTNLAGLATGILKNTTTTGVPSIAVGADLPTAIPIGSVGSAGLSGTAPVNVAATGAVSLTGAAGQVPNGAIGAFTATPSLGTDGNVAGTLQMANSAAAFHTIWGSGATANNTILGFASAPTTGDIVTCTTASTTCTLTDSGILGTNVVTLAGSQTLTNKTLTTPIISSITNTGTLTLPTASGTVCAPNGTLNQRLVDSAPGCADNREIITSIPSSDTISAAGAFATTESVAGTGLAVGSLITIHAHGVFTTTSTASPLGSFEVNAGGTTGICPAPTGTTLTVSLTAAQWELECFIQINTTGNPGTAIAWGTFKFANSVTLGTSTVRQFTNNTGTVSYITTTPENAAVQETATFVSGQTMTLQALMVHVDY